MGLSVQAKTAARPERPGYYWGSWINILLRVSWILLSAASRVSSHRLANVPGFSLHLRLHSLPRPLARLPPPAPSCAEELSRPRHSHPFHGWFCGDVASLNLAASKRFCRTCGLLRSLAVHLTPDPALGFRPNHPQSTYLTHTDLRVLCHLGCFHSAQRIPDSAQSRGCVCPSPHLVFSSFLFLLYTVSPFLWNRMRAMRSEEKNSNTNIFYSVSISRLKIWD